MAGTVSQGAAIEFVGYTEVYASMNSYADVINTPATIHIGTEPAALFAYAYMIAAHTTQKDIDKAILFIERLPVEFQVITLQGIIAKNPGIMKEPCINKWIAEKGAELF